MKNDIFKLIIFIAGITLFIEGLDSEFYKPTAFDIIKWLCYIILVITYVIMHRRKHNAR